MKHLGKNTGHVNKICLITIFSLISISTACSLPSGEISPEIFTTDSSTPNADAFYDEALSAPSSSDAMKIFNPFAPQESDNDLMRAPAYVSKAEWDLLTSTLHLMGDLPTSCHQLRVAFVDVQTTNGTPAPLLGAENEEVIQDMYIVVYKDGAPSVADNADAIRAQVEADGGRVEYIYDAVLNGYGAYLPPKALKNVRSDPNVAYVEADMVISVSEDDVMDNQLIIEIYSVISSEVVCAESLEPFETNLTIENIPDSTDTIKVNEQVISTQ